jgi:hypothetical protein
MSLPALYPLTILRLNCWPSVSWIEFEVKIMLRQTVSRSVSLGVKPQLGLKTRYQLRVCWCGATSLMRGRISHLQLHLTLVSAVILESRFPRGLRPYFTVSDSWLPHPEGLGPFQKQGGPVQSQSNFMTGGLPPISLSWRQTPWGSRPVISYLQLNPSGHSPYVTSSLSWRWVVQCWYRHRR